jgi:hypothetical protein
MNRIRRFPKLIHLATSDAVANKLRKLKFKCIKIFFNLGCLTLLDKLNKSLQKIIYVIDNNTPPGGSDGQTILEEIKRRLPGYTY